MATFEQVGLITQVIQNIYGLVSNMRDNASGYTTQAAQQGADFSAIATTMRADANLYLVRIGWITALATRNLTTFTAALSVFGITIGDANTLKATLTTVCNHTLAADLSSQAAINAEVTFILATVPNFERIF